MAIHVRDVWGFPIDLIRVGKYESLGTMNTVRAILSAGGIKSYVENEEQYEMSFPLSRRPATPLQPGESVELFVATRDWIAASELLRAQRQAQTYRANQQGGFPVQSTDESTTKKSARSEVHQSSHASPKTLIAATEHLTHRRRIGRTAPIPQPIAHKVTKQIPTGVSRFSGT